MTPFDAKQRAREWLRGESMNPRGHCDNQVCARCGSPFGDDNYCSRRVSGPCQGGRGEAPNMEERIAALLTAVRDEALREIVDTLKTTATVLAANGEHEKAGHADGMAELLETGELNRIVDAWRLRALKAKGEKP